MDPQEYLDAIKAEVASDVKDGILHSEENIQKIALQAQAKILGFEVDPRYGYVQNMTDEFAAELTEGSKEAIKILRKKIQKSATNKIKNIVDLEIPRLANYAFDREIQNIITEEREKALPIIRKVVKQVVHTELIQPWELIAKMQDKPLDIDLDEE